MDFSKLNKKSHKELLLSTDIFFKLHDTCKYLTYFCIPGLCIDHALCVKDQAMRGVSTLSSTVADFADAKDPIDYDDYLDAFSCYSHVMEWIQNDTEVQECEPMCIKNGLVPAIECLEKDVIC